MVRRGVKVRLKVYGGFLLGLVLFCLLTPGCSSVDKVFYHPDQRQYHSPENHDGYRYEEVSFLSEDGTALHGWFVPAVGEAKGTVIHFHGNAQNLSAHFGFVSWLPKQGYNLFTFDYRGYGKSEGVPTRQGIYEDSLAALDYLFSRTDIDRDKVIVIGQSLGGAIAIRAIAERKHFPIKGALIESTFSSYEDVVLDNVAFILKPVAKALVKDRLSPNEVVSELSPVPILFIHGDADHIVGSYHSERLYDLAGDPKELWIIKGGRHTEAMQQRANKYIPEILTEFKEWLAEE